MTEKKKIKKLKKEKKELTSMLQTCVEQMYGAADDLTAAAGLMEYMSGQIAAYRDCLKLDR